MRQLLRQVFASVFPCERTALEEEVGRGETPAPAPPNDGTVPIGGAPPDGSSPAPAPAVEGTPPDPQAQAELAQATELEAANTRIAELEADAQNREGRIDAQVEERLLQVMPPLQDDRGQAGVRQQEQQPPQQTPEYDPDDDTVEDRMDRLEQRVATGQRNQDAQNVINEIEGLRQKYRHMDAQKVLLILARGKGRELNIERLCEVSHRTHLADKEAFHQWRLSDTEHMKEIVATAERNGLVAGQPQASPQAPPQAPPALGQQETSGAPAPTQTPEKTHSGTATQTMVSGLQRLWPGGKEIGPSPK